MQRSLSFLSLLKLLTEAHAFMRHAGSFTGSWAITLLWPLADPDPITQQILFCLRGLAYVLLYLGGVPCSASKTSHNHCLPKETCPVSLSTQWCLLICISIGSWGDKLLVFTFLPDSLSQESNTVLAILIVMIL